MAVDKEVREPATEALRSKGWVMIKREFATFGHVEYETWKSMYTGCAIVLAWCGIGDDLTACFAAECSRIDEYCRLAIAERRKGTA